MTATTMKKPKPVRVKKVALYKFKDLSDEAKKKAREWWLESEDDCFDATDFGETVLQEHAEYVHGLSTDMKCYWSLNYCQGDGVAFYGNIDFDLLCKLPRWNYKGGKKSYFSTYGLRQEIKKVVDELQRLNFSVSAESEITDHHYHHWNSMSVRVEITDGPDFGSRWEDISKFIQRNPGWEDNPLACAVMEQVNDVPRDPSVVLVYLDWLEERGWVEPPHQWPFLTLAELRTVFSYDDSYADERQRTLEDLLDEYLKEVSRSTEKIGYEELEFRRTDEYVDETIEINEYTFTEDGEKED